MLATNGNTAGATPSVAIVVTVAPSVITANPAAATGVRPSPTWKSPGRIRPRAPVTSQMPMNLMNVAGNGDRFASTASGIASLNPPANRNRAASNPWMTHSVTRARLVVNRIGFVSPLSSHGAGGSAPLHSRRMGRVEIDIVGKARTGRGLGAPPYRFNVHDWRAVDRLDRSDPEPGTGDLPHGYPMQPQWVWSVGRPGREHAGQ